MFTIKSQRVSRSLGHALVVLAVLASLGNGAWATEDAEDQTISYELKQTLSAAVGKWIGEQTEAKNSDGVRFKRGAASRAPKRIDDGTYQVSVHINTAEDTRQVTERYTLTITKQDNAWTVTEANLADTVTLLFRTNSVKCYKFDKLAFDREGLKLSASNGDLCVQYVEGEVDRFGAHSDDLAYSYAPPDHAARFADGKDYHASHRIYKEVHAKDLTFEPQLFAFDCDPQSCEEILNEMFPGLERVPADERRELKIDPSDPSLPSWAAHMLQEGVKARRENPFAGFEPLDLPGHRHYSVFISRELKEPESGLRLAYNNWEQFDVIFSSWPKRWDIPDQLVGAVYGYFTEETLASSDADDLERRLGYWLRWLDIHSVRGEVDLGVEETELLRADVEYELNLKEDMKLLPFFISAIDPNASLDAKRPAPFSVDSVRLDGEELTWVQAGRTTGIAVLPETQPAGSRIKLGLSYSTRAIYKRTHSNLIVDRHSWLPFNRLGDYIEEYDLIIRSPSDYEIFGSGKMVEDRIDGDRRITRWTAEKPVNAPSVIMGKYISNSGSIEAKTLDGKIIPVTAHMDTVTARNLDVTTADLGPIANAAINSINLYTKISGFEYPFDELHLVNDPRGGLLHGEARSGMIFLGPGTFQSSAELAPYFLDAAYIARFSRSVVAHEVGHMWWGEGITFLNTRNWWFMETMPEYFSGLYLELAYGYQDYVDQVDEWRRTLLNSNLKGSLQNANGLFVGEYGGGRTPDSRTAAIYNKGPYALHMLREIFKGEGPRGPEGADKKFFDFLKQFCLALREKGEVVTLDIQRAAEEALGGVDPQGNRYNVDLSWFFEQWIRGAGIPQYALQYDVRQSEDGKFIIEGVISQQILLGTSNHVLDGQVYRGRVDLTVKTNKGGPYLKRLVINDPQTPFRVSVPARPIEVLLNEHGEMLSHDVRVNQALSGGASAGSAK